MNDKKYYEVVEKDEPINSSQTIIKVTNKGERNMNKEQNIIYILEDVVNSIKCSTGTLISPTWFDADIHKQAKEALDKVKKIRESEIK